MAKPDKRTVDLTDFIIVRTRTVQSHLKDAQLTDMKAGGTNPDAREAVQYYKGMITVLNELSEFRTMDAAERKAAINKVIRDGQRRG